ncbi:MAG: hypothetical protein ABIP17_01185 [Ilumatobacteraceae bacterium]
MRYSAALLASASLAIATGACAISSTAAGDGGGRLTIVQDLPDDVRAVLDPAWAAFLARFDGRRSCIADVEVVLVDHVEGGDARYVESAAMIEIEIPTTPAKFRESLVHELAHHVERTCVEFGELRAELHARFGLERPWSDGATWADIPAERWAETVVQLVNGDRILHRSEMPLDRSVLDVVEAWGSGAARWSDRADGAMSGSAGGITGGG